MIIYAIPAYNEGRNLDRLVNGISDAMTARNLDYRIVLVDDGSSDNTFELMEELGPNFRSSL